MKQIWLIGANGVESYILYFYLSSFVEHEFGCNEILNISSITKRPVKHEALNQEPRWLHVLADQNLPMLFLRQNSCDQ